MSAHAKIPVDLVALLRGSGVEDNVINLIQAHYESVITQVTKELTIQINVNMIMGEVRYVYISLLPCE